MSLALYRKYRPKTLEELIGQDTTAKILKNAAKSGSLGHAYLFYGPRGTGKTTTARLIAKLLNCEAVGADEKNKNGGEPCNKCRECEEIDSNSSMDVVEIDAASNRGIEEIRNLKEHIRTAPASGKHKVYIIDEVHMLTGPAFNALLKTLEEPPKHAVFVLATTEFEKLPATITSRTQRFLFRKPPKAKIISKLKSIAEAENISVDESSLDLIAAAAEGSFRDAESLLDQLASAGKTIDIKMTEEITGRLGFEKVHALSELIANRDLKGSLDYVSGLSEDGHNLTELTRDLIHYYRKAVALALNDNLKTVFARDLSDEELKRLSELAAKTNPELAIPMLKALIRGYSEMRYSPFDMIPLEIVLMEQLGKKSK